MTIRTATQTLDPAAQPSQVDQPNTTDDNVDLNNFSAAPMRPPQLSSLQGPAQPRQMQWIEVDGMGTYISVPAASRDVVHVYLKKFPPRPPANLEHIDGMLWNEFSLHIAHIMRQHKKYLLKWAAVGFPLLSITILVTLYFDVAVPLPSYFLFLFILWPFFGMKKIKEELKEIITEFVPKFENNGYGLEYFGVVGLFVFTRLPSSV